MAAEWYEGTWQLPEGTESVEDLGDRGYAEHYYHGVNGRRREYTASERGGIVVLHLMSNRGKRYTTGYIAKLTGMQRSGAYKLLCKLSRVTPIRQETVYVSDDGKLRDVWVIDK